MKYLYTKTKHYKIFVERNKTNRISKDIKILPESDKMNLFKLSLNINEEEIFNNPLVTKYDIFKLNDKFKKITFNSNSDTYYRVDIHTITESNGIVNHISFTEDNSKFDSIPNNQEDFQSYEDSYNKPSNKNEMIEVLNRIHYILNDLVNKNIIINKFCIGGTNIKEKNNIYEYFLKIIVGNDGFEKLDTEVYPTIGWGLYFSI